MIPSHGAVRRRRIWACSHQPPWDNHPRGDVISSPYQVDVPSPPDDEQKLWDDVATELQYEEFDIRQRRAQLEQLITAHPSEEYAEIERREFQYWRRCTYAALGDIKQMRDSINRLCQKKRNWISLERTMFREFETQRPQAPENCDSWSSEPRINDTPLTPRTHTADDRTPLLLQNHYGTFQERSSDATSSVEQLAQQDNLQEDTAEEMYNWAHEYLEVAARSMPR